MQTTIHDRGGLRRAVEIVLSYSELAPYFERAYAEVQKDLQLEGFRKGKVPIEIIKARYGAHIEQEALGDIASEAFRTAAQEHALDVVGTPVLVELERTADRGARVVVECDIMPDITLVPYEQIELVKPIRSITEADIDEELENIRLRNAELVPAEQITDLMYVVKLKFAPVDPETNAPLVGGKEQDFFLDDDHMDPQLREELLNLRKGDTFVYRTRHTSDEHRTHAHEHIYHVTVVDVQRVVLPELTEEFIASLTNGRLSTEEQLRSELRRVLEQEWEKQVNSYLRERLVDTMVELHEFDVPESLIRTMAEEFATDTLERNKEDKRLQQIPRQQLVEYFLPQAESAVRWQLIADTILRQEDIRLTEERLAALAERYGVDTVQLKMVLEQKPSLRNRLLTDALFDFLFARVRIVERPYEEIKAELEGEG
ncbi:MAG: trigger factor [Candidatus Kapabacteria bacterium]|nr:trigger factor [Candidatus Kapabacteria bacterium]